MNANQKPRGPKGALAIACGALLAGCMSATVDVPEVAVVKENLVFPGIPEDAPPMDDVSAEDRARYGLPPPGEAYQVTAQTFSYERVAVNVPSGMTTDLHVKSVTIRAHEGSPGLSFVQRLRLTVAKSTEPELAPVVLMEYPEAGTSPEPIDRSVTTSFNGAWTPIDPWKADSSVYTLDIWVMLEQMPRQNWALDVELVLRGTLDFDS